MYYGTLSQNIFIFLSQEIRKMEMGQSCLEQLFLFFRLVINHLAC